MDSPQPWECTAALTQSVGLLTAVYPQRRAAILSQQQARIEGALEHLKLRDGFDVVSQDDQYRVLEHVRSGARFDTTEQAPAPTLSELQLQFPARLQTAIDKALLELDSLRESKGEKPTVNVTLKLGGRELETEDGLERLLDCCGSRCSWSYGRGGG